MSETTQTETETQRQEQPGDLTVIKSALTQDIKSTILFFVRTFTAFNGILFGISSLFNTAMAYAAFQRCMYAFGLASLIRLSQRVGPVQFSKEYLLNVVLEDSAHFFLYSANFASHKPTTIIAVVPTVYCLLQSSVFLNNILKECNGASWASLKAQLNRLLQNQQKLLRLSATAEIFIMPLVLVQLFTGQCGSILTPLVYYQFLMLRYMSRRNPYVRTAFTELKMSINQLIYKPGCPAVVRTVVTKIMSLIERLSPVSYQQRQ